MKNIQITFIIILTCFLSLSKAHSKLQASFNYAVFDASDSGPYLETYLSVFGKTSKFILNENNKYQASIEITMIFKQKGEVINFNKYNLLSPEIADTTGKHPNFIDLQRISLPNGIYNFELTIQDKNSENEEFKFNDIVSIDIPENEISISGIQFIESYTETVDNNMLSKNGYDMIPYVSSFFPENMNTLIFYTEIYNANKTITEDENYLIKYFLENSHNKKILHDYSKFKRKKTGKTSVILAQFDITELSSGNYNLVIETRNKENELLSMKKLFFQRSNPSKDVKIEAVSLDSSFVQVIFSADTLAEYIKCLFPIASVNERQYIKNQLNNKSLENYRQFFYNFWLKRNSVNPEAEWNLYKEQVDMVHNLYGNKVFKGYETDMGRVYLQYGAPNSIVDSKYEPSAYPYEIWQYFVLDDGYSTQNNVKFVFYNPEKIGQYKLLHSTVRGEISDRHWKVKLNNNNQIPINFDTTGDDSNQFGNRIDENFNE